MGKYKKYINLIYLVIFVAMVVIAYTTSKYKPESVLVLFTDLSWLGDWPKWLDFPLMPFPVSYTHLTLPTSDLV